MFNFLKNLKTITRSTAEEAALVLRNGKTGLNAFDEMLAVVPVRSNEFGTLRIGEVHASEFNSMVRRGDLSHLFNVNNIKVPFTSVDETMFRNSVAHTAESRSHNINLASESAKKTHPHLDVKIKDLETLTEATRADVAKLEKAASSSIGRRLKIGMYIGVASLSAGWMYDNLRARRACHMSTNINGTVTSCRVQSHTCLPEVKSSSIQTCNGATVSDNNFFNITLVLMHLANMENNNDNELKRLVCAAANVDPSTMKTDLAKIIDNSYKVVSDVILANRDKIPKFNPCSDSHPDVEKGVIPICRMCSPDADPLSTKYIDPAQYADNVSFECVENPSLLDVVSDFFITTGSNILNGITSTLWTLLKPIIFIVGALAVLLALVLIAIQMFKTSQQKKTTTAAAAATTLGNSPGLSVSTTSLTAPLIA